MLTAVLARGLAVVLVTMLLAASAVVVFCRLRGEYLLNVEDASMAPVFRPGDALVIKPARWRELIPGQIVSFYSPGDNRVIVSHRIVKIDRQKGLVTTWGDALAAPDPPFARDQVAGRAEAVLPGFGRVLSGLRHPVGLILILYIPAITMLSVELRRLSNIFRRAAYRLHGYRC